MSNSSVPRDKTGLRIRKMTYAALFLAIALVLPFITMQIPEVASRISPMHIPVLLCGFMCGWPWGMAVGMIAPPLRSIVFPPMPAMFPDAVSMACELGVYGAVTGILYRILPRRKWTPYAALIPAMIAGRIVWGTVRYILAGLSNTSFTWEMFMAGAFINAVPAIILQLVLIPVLVMAMERAGLTLNRQK